MSDKSISAVPPPASETASHAAAKSAQEAGQQVSGRRPRIGFVSLGCPKNLVDSEVMMGMLSTAGAEITSRAEDADIIVVNTCSFIDSAKQESVDTILEMVRFKESGRAKKLIVAGCLVERYRDEIQKNIPQVDAVVGTGELDQILAAAQIERSGLTPPDSPFKILNQQLGQPKPEIGRRSATECARRRRSPRAFRTLLAHRVGWRDGRAANLSL